MKLRTSCIQRGDLGLLMIGNFLSSQCGIITASEELAIHLKKSGWPVITASNAKSKAVRFANMLWTVWARRLEYSVAQIAVFSGPAFLWAEMSCAMLRMLGKPYILTLHGGNLPQFARRWPGRVARLLASARLVTAPSEYLHRELSRYQRNVVRLSNAIDVQAYPYRLRKSPRPRLIWLRAFHQIYNPDLAPRVLALLSDEFPSIDLTMVGPDKGDGSLERTRRTGQILGVQNRIRYAGPVDKAQTPEVISKGDIFLNTTNVDNMPVSIIEALACGLCVISTNAGGIPDFLEHERDALLVPKNDASAMAASIRRVLTEPGLAERLSANARSKAEKLDWSATVPLWEDALMKVAGKSQAVRPSFGLA